MDLYYVFVWAFSVLFFAGVIYFALRNFNAYLEKERELNDLDEKFDNYKKHRSNLIVNSPSPSTTTTGHSNPEKNKTPKILKMNSSSSTKTCRL